MTHATTDSPYAVPQAVDSLADCHFYHAFEIPGFGQAGGKWDLRPILDDYLGHVNLSGKRVLEVGTADGYVTFEMERRGAEVVSHDLSPEFRWDAVPFAHPDVPHRNLDSDWVLREDFRHAIGTLNKAYWLAHKAFNSKAKVVYCDIYSLPADIGIFDVVTFGSVLLHLRDPFRAIEVVLSHTSETVVITEYQGRFAIPPQLRKLRDLIPARYLRPAMRFTPDPKTQSGADGWWKLSPEIIRAFVGVLGFGRSELSFHEAPFDGRKQKLFTVVAHRTTPLPR